MRQAAHLIVVPTRGKGLRDVTRPLSDSGGALGIVTGLLTVWCRHTSASLTVQENADPDVRTDLQAFMDQVAPEAPGRYVHDAEGPDDMPAHIRAVLTQTSLAIPVLGGRPALGTWQAVYLWEHRNRPHRRELALHLLGD